MRTRCGGHALLVLALLVAVLLVLARPRQEEVLPPALVQVDQLVGAVVAERHIDLPPTACQLQGRALPFRRGARGRRRGRRWTDEEGRGRAQGGHLCVPHLFVRDLHWPRRQVRRHDRRAATRLFRKRLISVQRARTRTTHPPMWRCPIQLGRIFYRLPSSR